MIVIWDWPTVGWLVASVVTLLRLRFAREDLDNANRLLSLCLCIRPKQGEEDARI